MNLDQEIDKLKKISVFLKIEKSIDLKQNTKTVSHRVRVRSDKKET